MTIEKLYALNVAEGKLSPDDCSLINKKLLNLNANLIPKEQLSNLLDYINLQLLFELDERYLTRFQELDIELSNKLG